jgi:hypothetical protein
MQARGGTIPGGDAEIAARIAIEEFSMLLGCACIHPNFKSIARSTACKKITHEEKYCV